MRSGPKIVVGIVLIAFAVALYVFAPPDQKTSPLFTRDLGILIGLLGAGGLGLVFWGYLG